MGAEFLSPRMDWQKSFVAALPALCIPQ